MRCYCSIVVNVEVGRYRARCCRMCETKHDTKKDYKIYSFWNLWGTRNQSPTNFIFETHNTGGCLPIYLQNYGVTQLTPVSSWSTHQLNQINFYLQKNHGNTFILREFQWNRSVLRIDKCLLFNRCVASLSREECFFTRNCITTNFSLLFLLNFSIK